MKNAFNAGTTAKTEGLLNEWDYSFQRQSDGRLLVQGNIDLAHRGLMELPDLSCVIVTGNFYCQDNLLTSLKGAPSEVRGGFWCYNNQLTSLEHTPASITGQFICHNNKLTSLEHVPERITGDFTCSTNLLTSLEGAPKQFNNLTSDFGTFKTWNDVPERLRCSPETIAANAQKAVVLQERLRVSKPLTLRKHA
jgi:hypothetical protein